MGSGLTVTVEAALLEPFDTDQIRAPGAQAARHGEFFSLPVAAMLTGPQPDVDDDDGGTG